MRCKPCHLIGVDNSRSGNGWPSPSCEINEPRALSSGIRAPPHGAKKAAKIVKSIMSSLADLLRTAINDADPRLLAITESAAAENPLTPGGWSRKQELGHLIDSAVNNRVRFIRTTLE